MGVVDGVGPITGDRSERFSLVFNNNNTEYILKSVKIHTDVEEVHDEYFHYVLVDLILIYENPKCSSSKSFQFHHFLQSLNTDG